MAHFGGVAEALLFHLYFGGCPVLLWFFDQGALKVTELRWQPWSSFPCRFGKTRKNPQKLWKDDNVWDLHSEESDLPESEDAADGDEAEPVSLELRSAMESLGIAAAQGARVLHHDSDTDSHVLLVLEEEEWELPELPVAVPREPLKSL